MTIVDTADLRARACGQCGAVVWDGMAHARWHAKVNATLSTVYETLCDVAADVAALATTTEEDPPCPEPSQSSAP